MLLKILNLSLLFTLLVILMHACEIKMPAVEALPEQSALPDPFVMFDGTPVETEEDWYRKRRPELKRLFQHYVYGYLPAAPQMRFETTKIDSTFFEGKATYKEIIIHMILPDGLKQQINLALFMPNKRPGPLPVFIGVNKCGNHTLVANQAISIIERAWVHGRLQRR